MREEVVAVVEGNLMIVAVKEVLQEAVIQVVAVQKVKSNSAKV
jgi:hypothetical protein